MLLLAAYAAISWFAIYRLRRSWAGVAMLLLSLAGVALLSYLDIMIHRLVVGGDPSLVFQFILASEAAMILFVGAMLVMVPRERVAVPCRGCGYELHGLDDANPRCPECGIEHAARRPRAGRCVQCNQMLPLETREVALAKSLELPTGAEVTRVPAQRTTAGTCERCAIGQGARAGRTEPVAELAAPIAPSHATSVASMAT